MKFVTHIAWDRPTGEVTYKIITSKITWGLHMRMYTYANDKDDLKDILREIHGLKKMPKELKVYYLDEITLDTDMRFGEGKELFG